ncbi:sialate O-acetylesterase [Ruminococcus sp. YE71]|uniref:sialate O-acetylesterase n=1 Tax=unclassified Ruminococcus TaxID=2608920 RepID=UPI000881FB5D|nr:MULTISPECIES: sialate O-acetylesterase [unclassified Ruminococcus]SDA17126.1 sialate O-acetylesterase [Ruminococcus sp. YE78]SFW26244.1 sialate O-acetylesterase [Ruminococcus sp. YE71]
MSFSVMRYIADGAVLQCGEPFELFGHSEPSAEVTLTLTHGGKVTAKVTSRADDSGRFTAVIPAVSGGFESYELELLSGGEQLFFTDILFGEVFHISGQSNMELPLRRTYHPFKPFEHRECGFIREFRVPVECCFTPDYEDEDFRGGYWMRAEGEQMLGMSGAGYYFALVLMDELKCPVGLLNTSAGGCAIESRMPAPMLRDIGGYEDRLGSYADPDFMKNRADSDAADMRRWYETLGRLDRVGETVFGEDFIPEGRMNIPLYFRETDELKGFSGRVWMRKKFVIHESTELRDAELILGNIIDNDRAYINGEKVGETGYMYPPRYYRFDPSVLRHGENTAVVCMEVKGGDGGFVRGKDYCLKVGGEVIDLSGEWEYTAVRTETLSPSVFFPELPMALWAAMTTPAFRVNIRGMLWYQGETNTWHPEKYFGLFARFTELVRERCGKELPIITVQLPNFAGHGGTVGTNWAVLRLQQEKCTELPNCGMAVTIGCGESNDLHPIDKKTVGERLAWETLELVYGRKMKEKSRCVSAEWSDGKVTLTFSAETELVNSPALYFEAVCGGKAVTLAAEKTSPHTVVLPCAAKPEQVRYAFNDDPSEPDLFSRDGLPVAPFVFDIT